MGAGSYDSWLMGVEHYKDAYPNAKTIGSEDIHAKVKGWKLDSGRFSRRSFR